MKKISASLQRTVRKISLFNGLAPSELRLLLGACRQSTVEQGETLCRAGEASKELYVLLSGAVNVNTEDGVKVGRVKAVNTVGEMGFITYAPRSATVAASERTTVLSLSRQALDEILARHEAMRAKVYQNIIWLLSQKIIAGNVQTRDMRVAQMRQKRRIAELQQRLDFAMEMVVQECGVDREAVERKLDKGVDESRSLEVEAIEVENVGPVEG